MGSRTSPVSSITMFPSLSAFIATLVAASFVFSCGREFLDARPAARKPLAVTAEPVIVAPLGCARVCASGGAGGYAFSCVNCGEEGSGGAVDPGAGAKAVSCPPACPSSEAASALSGDGCPEIWYKAGEKGGTVDVVDVRDLSGETARASITVSGGLSVFPEELSLSPGEVRELFISGGRPPYSVELSENESYGVYLFDDSASVISYTAGTQAPAEDGFTVTDANCAAAAVRIHVAADLAIIPDFAALSPGQVFRFNASGRNPPFRFSHAPAGNFSGSTLDEFSGDYLAGPLPATIDRIDVRSRIGERAEARVHVLDLLSLDTTAGGMVAADFDADGNLDFAVSLFSLSAVDVFFGDGGLSFPGRTRLGSGASVTALASADFDEDGNFDLCAVNQQGIVLFHFGDGTGEFPLASRFAAPGVLTSIAVADFNADGAPDAAVSSKNGVYLFLSDAAKGFSYSMPIPDAGADVESIAAADVNEDGKMDLLVLDFEDTDGLSLFLGDGRGEFVLHGKYLTGIMGIKVSVLDFNADGRTDAAVLRQGLPGIALLDGSADNYFEEPIVPMIDIRTKDEPATMLVDDFNGDGKPDIAVAEKASNTIGLFLGKGGRQFDRRIELPADRRPFALAAGDFDGDGRDDLAVAHAGSNTVGVLQSSEKLFGAKRHDAYPAGSLPWSAGIDDFNLDGYNDVALVNHESGTIGVFYGGPLRRFSQMIELDAGSMPMRMCRADFDRDGDIDILASNGAEVGVGYDLSYLRNLTVHPRDSTEIPRSGEFAPPETYDLKNDLGVPDDGPYDPSAVSVSCADLDGDGNIDVALGDQFNAMIYFLSPDEEGGFSYKGRIEADLWEFLYLAWVADLDSDGMPDVIAAPSMPTMESAELGIWINEGGLRFREQAVNLTGGGFAQDIAFCDVDGDGGPDIVAACQDSVNVMFNEGGDISSEPREILFGGTHHSVSCADVNADGTPDVVTSIAPSNVFAVVSGASLGEVDSFKYYRTAGGPQVVVAEDIDADGFTDVAVASAESNDLRFLWGRPDGAIEGGAEEVSRPGKGLCEPCESSFECGGPEDVCYEPLSGGRAASLSFCSMRCRSDEDCDYGYFCENDARCVPAPESCLSNGAKGLCDPCERDDECGGFLDLCAGGSCGSDCSAGNACPAGYVCEDQRVPHAAPKTIMKQCVPSGGTCR